MDAIVSQPSPNAHIGAQVRPRPLIAVRDVRRSGRWYADLLAADTLPEHPHRDIYQRISRGGALLLQLHAWDKEDHPNLIDADAARLAHGVVLWFEVDDFDAAVDRARKLGAEIIEGPFVNPAPQHRELWLRDPDGFVLALASPDGEAAG